MLNHSITRYGSGILLNGGQLKLHFSPNHYGKISVYVAAKPSITGFDSAVRLTSDEQPSFRPGEIQIDDNAITCMAASEIMTAFREGFICLIEPGMAPLLREWLPRLESVARTSESIWSAAHGQLMAMEPPVHINHLFHAFPVIASAILLDGFKTKVAIEALRADKLYGSDPILFTVLASESVQTLLVEAEQHKLS